MPEAVAAIIGEHLELYVAFSARTSVACANGRSMLTTDGRTLGGTRPDAG